MRGRRGLAAFGVASVTLLVGGCTDSADSKAVASSSDAIPGGRSTANAPQVTAAPGSLPEVKATDGPPWKVLGDQEVSALVGEPENFDAGELAVPADHVAVTIRFDLKNAGETPYQSGGFTAGLASSEPCEGFAYISENVTGVPETVDPGDVAEFKYGYICKGESGDKLTLKVGVDPNSGVTSIKTKIP